MYSKRAWLAACAIGSFLFVVNHLAVWSGWMAPPAGYFPLLFSRTGGLAMQNAWFEGFRTRWLLPNYQGPWSTEPAFFNPLKFAIGRLAEIAGVSVAAPYLLFHWLAYVGAALALSYALFVFCDSRRQRIAAAAVALCAMPLPGLTILPRAILGIDGWRSLPGIGDFVYWSCDGFLHGISGSLSSTIATALVVFALTSVAQYLNTGERRFLWRAGIAGFLTGAIHPYEIPVISIAGGLALLILRGKRMRDLAVDLAILGGSIGAGIAFYAMQILRHDWLRDQSALLKWEPGSPLWVLQMLGLPAIAALLWTLIRPVLAPARTLVLEIWIAVVLVGIYVPVFNWTQHFFDGFHYAAALLLVRRWADSGWRAPRTAVAGLGVLTLIALAAHAVYRVQSFRDGRRVEPVAIPSTVAPVAMLEAIQWLRRNASSEDLVLAPRKDAGWYATAPMHSFASHFQLGITYPEQASLSDAFFAGTLPPDGARSLIEDYGVRWVVTPPASPVLRYLTGRPRRADFGDVAIYEFPGNAMKPYPRLRRK